MRVPAKYSSSCARQASSAASSRDPAGLDVVASGARSAGGRGRRRRRARAAADPRGRRRSSSGCSWVLSFRCPEVGVGVGAPRAPTRGAFGGGLARGRRARAPRARAARRGPTRGTRPDRRRRASSRTRRSTVRCPAARAASARSCSRSAPGSIDDPAVGDRGRHAAQRRGPGPRHRELVGIDRRHRGGVREQVRDRSGRRVERLAVLRDEPAEDRAGAGDRHLLADDGPHDAARSRRDDPAPAARAGAAPAAAAPGPARSAASTATGSASRSKSRRVRATAAVRSRRSSSRNVPVTASGAGREREHGVAVRQRERPPVRAGRRRASIAGDRTRPEEREHVVAGERRARREPDRDAARLGRGPPRVRIALGVDANTSRIVSLNWRMLAKPDANAMSAKRRSVVSMSTRAVWARCARASASGRRRARCTSRRCSCRSLYASRAASPDTPSRSTTPSPMSRIARATTSPRGSHSGEPGDASGRQRLHARYPARCAAAAVGKNSTFLGYGVRAGQLGRQ